MSRTSTVGVPIDPAKHQQSISVNHLLSGSWKVRRPPYRPKIHRLPPIDSCFVGSPLGKNGAITKKVRQLLEETSWNLDKVVLLFYAQSNGQLTPSSSSFTNSLVESCKPRRLTNRPPPSSPGSIDQIGQRSVDLSTWAEKVDQTYKCNWVLETWVGQTQHGGSGPALAWANVMMDYRPPRSSLLVPKVMPGSLNLHDALVAENALD